MKLVVDGEPFEAAGAGTVTALLEELGLRGRAVAVVLNGELLPASAREARRLREGDRVELFRLVAGG